MSAAPPDDAGGEPDDLELRYLSGAVAEGTLAALARVHAACFSRGWSEEELSVLLSSPGCGAFIACDGADIAGFVLFRSARVETEVLTLGVDPQRRRQGVGARLTAAFAAWTMASGADRAHLEVAADNDAAIGLYRKLGFVVSGRRPSYYPRGGRAIDALCMSLPRPEP